MQDKEFYQQILGLQSPWFVADVKLDTENQQVDIHVEHPQGTKFCCPECKQSLALLRPMHQHASGVISIRCNSRRSCMQPCLA